MTTLHDTASPVQSGGPRPADSVNVSVSPAVAFHESAVSDIVGMIRDKYDDDAKRSFAIGRRFFEHAVWQKNNFTHNGKPGEYTNADFNNLASRIRDEVRVHVAIKPESIRVADWARSHVLRECVRTAAGDDVADSLSMHEYLAIVGKALHFNVRDLEGDLNPCWLDTIKGIATTRATGGRVTTEQFLGLVKATGETAKLAKVAALDPDKAAELERSATLKANERAKSKAAESVLSSLDTGIKSGAIQPAAALEILESVAKAHGKPLVANAIGFDPANATVADAELLCATLFNLGRVDVMRAMVAKLAKGLATIDRAEKRAAKSAETAAPVAVGAAA